jgi:hypothetical protein
MKASVMAQLKWPPDTREKRNRSSITVEDTAMATESTPCGPSSASVLPGGTFAAAVSYG